MSDNREYFQDLTGRSPPTTGKEPLSEADVTTTSWTVAMSQSAAASDTTVQASTASQSAMAVQAAAQTATDPDGPSAPKPRPCLSGAEDSPADGEPTLPTRQEKRSRLLLSAVAVGTVGLLLLIAAAVLIQQRDPDGQVVQGTPFSGEVLASSIPESGGAASPTGSERTAFALPQLDADGVYRLPASNLWEEKYPASPSLERQSFTAVFSAASDLEGVFPFLDMNVADAYSESEVLRIQYYLEDGVYRYDGENSTGGLLLEDSSLDGRALLLRLEQRLLLFRPEETALTALTPRMEPTSGAPDFTPLITNTAVSPHGKYVTFSSNLRYWQSLQVGESNYMPESDVWVVDLQTGRRKVLCENAAPVCCSLTDTYLYFDTRDYDGYLPTESWLAYVRVELESGQSQDLPAVPRKQELFSIQISDRNRLQGHFSYTLSDKGEQPGGSVYNLETGAVIPFAFQSPAYSPLYYSATPRLSADGRYLACPMSPRYSADDRISYVGIVNTADGQTTLYRLPAEAPDAASLTGMKNGILLFQSEGRLVHLALGKMPGR